MAGQVCQACGPFAICAAMTTGCGFRTCRLPLRRHEGTRGHGKDSSTSQPAADRTRFAGHPGISAGSAPTVRAALGSRGLGEYADDAEIITSELVTNAVQHACA